MYGSYGFSLAGILAGAVVAKTSVNIIFPIHAGLIAFAGIFIYLLRTHNGAPVKTGTVWNGRAAMSLFRDVRFICLLLYVLVIQITFAIHSTFFGIYVDSMGLSESVIGVGWTIGSLACIPLFILLPRGLDRYGPTPSSPSPYFGRDLHCLRKIKMDIRTYPKRGSFNGNNGG